MKPCFRRYYAAYRDGWSAVVENPGEWVWAYFYPGNALRPVLIARDLGLLLQRMARRP